MKRQHAFSLVELLVVLGVIAIVIALLLPVLGRARAEANRVACMSNLRQLLLAQLQYVGDSKGFLTYPNWGDDRQSQDVWPSGWLYTQGKVSDPPSPADVKAGALYPYLNEVRVFRCPLGRPDDASTEKGTDRLTSYIMNGAVCGYGVVGHKAAEPVLWMPSWKITDWRRPSEQVLWWEADETSPGAGWNDGASYPWENVLSRRHGRGACVGYFDGSAGWMDRLDYVAELQRPGPNRLYCDPHRADGGKSARGPNGQ